MSTEFCKPQSFLNMVPPLVMNLVTDLLIMAIPAPVILPVKTTVARKIGLFVLFFAGIFIMTAAILRVVFVVMVSAYLFSHIDLHVTNLICHSSKLALPQPSGPAEKTRWLFLLDKQS